MIGIARLVSGMVLLALSAAAQAQAERGEAPLGLWVWSAEQPAVQFRLTLESVDTRWRASAAGVFADAQVEDGAVAVAWPDGRRFDGVVSADGAQVRGYWFQPASPVAYLDVATPVVLPATEAGWSAEIMQQPRPYRVFLDVFESEGGGLRAVIRNPERNDIERATRFRVEPADDAAWTLIAGHGDREIRRRIERSSNGALTLEYSWFENPIALRPASAVEAEGYYGRPSSDTPVGHVTPPALDDGWRVASADEAGFDPAALDALVAELASADPRSPRPSLVHSVLVAHQGRLVFEEYFRGYGRDTAHDVRSMGKVFGSVLIGALRQDGVAIDTDQRTVQRVLERAGDTLDDPRKAEITLAHIMTYTTGLDCSSTDDSLGSEWRMWEQDEEDDYWLFTARLPLLHAPGSRYAYCSGSANLVGAALVDAAGEPVHQIFDRLIARPLGFGGYHWNLAPNGEGYLGGGAYMRPRDILKIGAVYAAGGVWNGVRIIPEAWIEASTAPRVPINEATTGLSADDFADHYIRSDQAFIWRVDEIIAGDARFTAYLATGNGGQILIVIPELELSAVFTGGNYRMGGIWNRWPQQVLGDHIIPAMTERR